MVSTMTKKIVVQPNKELKSPFLVKRHLLFSRPDPNILDELYKLATADDEESRQAVWVSSNHPPFPIKLKLADIQKSVKPKEHMDTTCLNLAVRNTTREDAENFKNTKCLGWRHYVDSVSLQLNDPNNLRIPYSGGSTVYDASGSHLVFIPIIHDGHWTLYAFNMCDQKLCILDSQSETSEDGLDPSKRHEKTRRIVCGALNLIVDSAINFLSWEYEFPKVPRQQNSFDSGFFVFNFMRFWDGHRLVRWFSTETTELRKDFLAYILLLSFKNNDAVKSNVSQWIKKLSGEAMMNLELLEVARQGNAKAFRELKDHASISINHEQENQNHSALGSNATSTITSDEGDSPIPPTASAPDVTAEGDGVLHIAASFCHVKLVEAILEEQDGAIVATLLQAGNNRGDRPLHYAAASGSIEMVKLIVRKAKEVDPRLLRAENLDGQTCLHEAVRLGHMEVVEHLVSEDAGLNDPNSIPLVKIVDNQGVSPLYLAITLRRDCIVSELIKIASCESGAVASYSGPEGKTALHAAVLLCEELSNVVVEWNPGLIKIPDESGSTPLHYLADGKFKSIIFGSHFTVVTKLLLKKDPSSGYRADSKGSLPLHIAAANGRLDIIRQFIKMNPGCESSCDASGQTILHVAAQMGMWNVVLYVCSDKKFRTILNMEDNDGNTALHLAVQKGYSGIFGILMGCKNVHLSFRNKNGHTPLDLAVQSSRSRLIYWPGDHEWICNDLLFAGADFGTFRGDQYSGNIHKADTEALSENVSKSAAVMAACAAVMFNAALTILTNVESVYYNDAKNATLGSDEAKLTRRVKTACGYSLTMSAWAILCSVTAGLPILGVKLRIPALTFGLLMIMVSSVYTLDALAARVYLASTQRRAWVAASSAQILFWCASFCTILVCIMMLRILTHAWARCARLGPLEFCRSLFKIHAQQSPVPAVQVFILVEAVSLTFTAVLVGVDIARHHFRAFYIGDKE